MKKITKWCVEYHHLISRSVVDSKNIKREYMQALDENGAVYHVKL